MPHLITIGGTYAHKTNFYRVTLLSFDGMTAVFKKQDDGKIYTRRAVYFMQQFTQIPGEKSIVESKQSRPEYPKGEVGIGGILFNRFLAILDQEAPVNLFKTFNKKGTVCSIVYNGYKIFECQELRRRFTVRCNPKSLSPKNYAKAEIMEKMGILSARYMFTSVDDLPLMSSIIIDGLYYRRLKMEEK